MLIKLRLSCIELINTKSSKASTNHHGACVRGHRHLVKSYSLYHNTCSISWSGSLLRQTTLAYIHENIQQNDETTATDLQKVLHKETGTLISLSTIKRARSKLGWVQTGVKYCQLIRLQNKVKGLNFALKCLQTQDDLKDVISPMSPQRPSGVCARRPVKMAACTRWLHVCRGAQADM